MKVPGINLPDVSISTGMSGDEMALVLQDSNLVLRALSDILSVDQKLPRVIAQSNIPFLIMPGDGAANGCQFTGTNGAFTLSAAILANTGSILSGCYAYFSSSFGGSSLPAGWYWTEFDTGSDTTGIVYSETYTTGAPRRPVTRTAITPNLSGWVTATTNEVTGPQGFLLSGAALGENGSLNVKMHQCGSTAGTKTFRVRADDSGTTVLVLSGTSAAPVLYSDHYIQCMASISRKFIGRSDSTAYTGLGSPSALIAATGIIEVDTSIDRLLSISLRGSTNLAAPVLVGAAITSTYGA